MSEKKENPYLNHNLQDLLSVRDLFGRVLNRAQEKRRRAIPLVRLHILDPEDLVQKNTIHDLEEAIEAINEAIEIKKTERGEE